MYAPGVSQFYVTVLRPEGLVREMDRPICRQLPTLDAHSASPSGRPLDGRRHQVCSVVRDNVGVTRRLVIIAFHMTQFTDGYNKYVFCVSTI